MTSSNSAVATSRGHCYGTKDIFQGNRCQLKCAPSQPVSFELIQMRRLKKRGFIDGSAQEKHDGRECAGRWIGGHYRPGRPADHQRYRPIGRRLEENRLPGMEQVTLCIRWLS